jgi:ferredoxin
MDFSGNPAADEDWPDTVVEFDRGNGSESTFLLPVTVADWALLQDAYADEYLPVPPGSSTEALTPLGTYLSLAPEEAMERIPYVWGVTPDGKMRRLVVTRRLTIACRERLDFWHTLQELAGIRSEYVLEAVRRTRAEAEAEAAEERESMAAAHAEELAEARRTAVADAMQTLSNRLLDLDLAMPLAAMSGAAAGAPTAAPPTPSAAPAPAAPAAEPEPAIISDEPWIDTPLCTSCNDCINVNQLLFTYDGNKQAIIGDPKGGTFAQLVMAAEKCPARCIHPGMPLNPEESGLEDLLRRAKPFQ